MAAPLVKESIPLEIITDILSGLPVKSLTRFRCVSKPWLCFISDPRFAYRHLMQHLNCEPGSKDCIHNQTSLFFISDKSKPGGLEKKVYSVGGGNEEDAFKVPVEFDFPLIGGNSYQIKTACCHGRVCLVIDNFTLVLWNPSIREYKILPKPFRFQFCKGVCGLGFAPSIQDYKVVSVVRKRVYIFSVMGDFWRKIGVGKFQYVLHNEGIGVNGCLYWAAARGYGNKPDIILCLHLSYETFREVALPPHGDSAVAPDFYLLLRGGDLCAFRGSDQSLWVMKYSETNQEVAETWTKVMTLPWILKGYPHPFYSVSITRIPFKLRPKCFTKSGKLLVSVENMRFAMYDPEIRLYEYIHFPELGQANYQKAIAYTESLVR